MARARIKVGDGVRWCVRCGAVYDCGVKPKGRSRSSEKKINKKKQKKRVGFQVERPELEF